LNISSEGVVLAQRFFMNHVFFKFYEILMLVCRLGMQCDAFSSLVRFVLPCGVALAHICMIRRALCVQSNIGIRAFLRTNACHGIMSFGYITLDFSKRAR